MDLALSSRGRYALRAAVFLAAEYRSGTLRTQQQVSDAMGVPRRLVPQVLSDLVRSGLVVSAHGAHGGYRLARPPGQVRLLDVVEAGEGLLDSAGGVRSGGSAERAASRLQVLLTDAGTRFRRVLAVTTLEHLVGRPDAAAPHPGSLPCGVLTISRAQGATVRVGGGLAVHEQVGEEPVDRRFDRVGTSASPERRHGGGGEDDAVEEERDQ
ncbi:MAG: RrF2 family transcriptional regulator [Acidimicrobiales bacterium]